MQFSFEESVHFNSSFYTVDRDYWTKVLQEISTLKKPETGTQRFTKQIIFDGEIQEKIISSAQNHPYAVFILVNTCFQISLAFWLNARNISFAFPSLDKYNDFLPFSAGFDFKQSFRELLNQSKGKFTESLQFARFPIQLLKQSTDILKQIDIFCCSDTIHSSNTIEKERWAIFFRVFHNEQELGLEIICEEFVFSEKLLEKFIHSFVRITQKLLANPDETIRNAFEEEGIEQIELNRQYNPKESNYPKDRTVHQFFSEIAKKFPENIALTDEKRQISYCESDKLSDEVAAFILAQKLIPTASNCIAVLLPPSIELILCFLGISKAGRAYLPLNIEFPDERIRFMLADSETALLITSKNHHFSNNKETPTLYIEDIFNSQKDIQYDSSPPVFPKIPHPSGGGRGGLYLTYTSGTTGQPKSCIVSHQNLLNLLCNEEIPFDFSEKDVWIMAHSPAFDFSVWEIYGALLYGGKLIIPSRETVKDTSKFREMLILHQVTILNQTPSAFQNLVTIEENEAKKELNQLRYVIFGGEKLKAQLLDRWIKRYPIQETRLINMYGITETTVHVTFYALKEEDIEENTATIGSPLPNVQVFICDENQNLLPVGVWGEMYVSGAGVSWGYFHRPALNLERFISLNFCEGVFYKSGDIARWTEDGLLEYKGRKDSQVKIRGYRIELGEIEYHIRKHIPLKECIIKVFYQNENLFLVAYYITDEQIAEQEIRQTLSLYLPDYMIPAYFVQIESIPLTLNGKIDFDNLPNPFETNKDKLFKKPETEKEKLLCEIWQEVLGLEKIGTEDHFFHVGGDSIKAIQIAARLQKAGFSLEIRNIFEKPQISQLVSLLKPVNTKEIKKDEPNAYLQGLQNYFVQIHSTQIVEKVYRLSPTQEGLHFRALLDTQSKAYHEQLLYVMEGNLNVDFFLQAYGDLVKRQAMLRTVFFADIAEVPLQVVIKEGFVDFYYQDLRHFSENEKDDFIQNYRQKDLEKSYDLQNGALMRLALLQRAENCYVILWSHHHILLDGWCLQLLIKEFFEIYQTKIQRRSPNLPEIQPYQNYINWVHQHENKDSLIHWQQYLKGYSETAIIPFSKNTKNKNTYQHQSFQFAFDTINSHEILKFCQETEITLSTFLQVVWALLLQRYNNAEDVVFGKVVSGRPPEVEGIEQMIGLFINTLPVRVKCEGTDCIKDLLKKHNENILDEEQHQYTPLHVIQKLSPLKENLFKILFVFENYPLSTQNSFLGEDFKILETDNYEQTEYDFNLIIWYSEQQIYIRFLFNENLIEKAFVEKIKGHFSKIIKQIITKPGIKVREIEIIKEAEKEEIFRQNNQSFRPYPENQNILDLFEKQAYNDNMAVYCPKTKEKLSFREVLQRAKSLAIYLKEEIKLQKGERMALLLERNENLLPALIGILYSECIYVPIDLSYPEERIRYILEDSQASVLLTDQKNSIFYQKIIHLQDVLSKPTPPFFSPLWGDQGGLGLYLIYTSGSTGKPKGVEITGENLYNFICWALEEFAETPFKTLLAGTSACFDLSVFELFYGFCSGKTIRILESNADIADNLDAENILINTVPLVLKSLLQSKADLSNVRAINSAGEPIPAYIIEALQQYENLEIRNLYAPSETTTYSTCYHFSKNNSQVVIGKPISNTQIYILDQYGFLQPDYVSGELIIGGKGVAKGYWNQPELTKTRFKSLPLIPPKDLGEVYFTGDIARRFPEGNFEFIGRKDEQVKINGYRIELGEIEHQLLQISQNTGTAVIIVENQSGKQMIAFIEAEELNEKELLQKLKEKLPAYMLPSFVMSIAQIPLNNNGKTDKKALELYYKEHYEEKQEEYISAQSKNEIILLEIWQELLGISQISILDNFFRLGGDSIKVMQMAGILRKKGFQLEMKAVFEYPTIRELQHQLKATEKFQNPFFNESQTQVLAPIQAWFFEHFKNQYNHFNQSVFLKTDFQIDAEKVGQTIDFICQYHTIFQSCFVKEGGNFKQIWENNLSEVYELKEIFLDDSKTFETLKNEVSLEADSAQNSLNIEQGKSIQIRIFQHKNHSHILFVVHHLLIDGVSWRIFLEDFLQTYTSLLHENSPDSLFITNTYQDWKHSLRFYLQNEKSKKELNYWMDLHQKVCNLGINTQTNKAYSTYKDSKILEIKLDVPQTETLLRGIHGAFQTEINDILLAALSLAHQKRTGENYLFLSIEGHGREPLDTNLDLNRTIGWFTSIYPVLLETQANNPERHIKLTKENLRKIPSKGIGYGILKYLQPESPLLPEIYPEISFNYLGQFDDLVQNNISLSPFPSGNAVSPESRRLFLIDINAMIINKEWLCTLSYDAQLLNAEDMEIFAENFKAELERIIDFCKKQDKTDFTPSDFGNTDLSLDELAMINQVIERLEE